MMIVIVHKYTRVLTSWGELPVKKEIELKGELVATWQSSRALIHVDRGLHRLQEFVWLGYLERLRLMFSLDWLW